MSTNLVILEGNIGKEISLNYTSSGDPVANFSVATDRYWTGQDGEKKKKTTWHRIQVWGKQAENCKTYLKAGSKVFIEGSSENENYTSKDGMKHRSYFIKAKNVQFLSRPTKQEELGDDHQGELPLNDMPHDEPLPF